MAKYFMAKLDTNLWRLRVELTDEVAQFTFLYFENQYRILTYAFIPLDSDKSQLFKNIGGWTEVGREKAEPIIEQGIQKYQAMVDAFKKQPNF